MAKHKFWISLNDEQGNVVGTRCGRCGEIVFYVNSVVPPEKMAEECPREGMNQAAAPVVREATERD